MSENWAEIGVKAIIDAVNSVSETDKSRQHRAIVEEMHKTYKAKNHDYGDAFGESVKEWGLVAGIVRIGDKYNRSRTLIKNNVQKVDENLRDTLIDMANYCIMLVIELDNKEGNEDGR